MVGIVALVAIVILVLGAGWVWLNRAPQAETPRGGAGGSVEISLPTDEETDTNSQ